MRQYLIITLSLLVVACSNDDTDTEPTTGQSISVRVRLGENLQSSHPVDSYLWIFRNEGTAFQAPDPVQLLSENRILDEENIPINALLVKRRFQGVFLNELEPGNYHLVTMLFENGRHSVIDVSLSEGEVLILDKFFPDQGNDFALENW